MGLYRLNHNSGKKALAIGNNGSGYDVYDFDQNDELILGARRENNLVAPSLSGFRVSRMILTPLHYDEVINDYLYELELHHIPNPGGKLGDAETRHTTERIKKDLESKGFRHFVEVYFEKGSRGVKDRYADVVGKHRLTGMAIVINIGRKTKEGRPIKRERLAMRDIFHSKTYKEEYTGSKIRFVGRGDSGLFIGIV